MKKILLLTLSLSVVSILSSYGQAQPKNLLEYYNTITHKHIYTTDGNEINPGHNGWVYDTTLGQLYSSIEGPAVYRWYQASTTAHYLSKSSTIHPGGYVLEGVVGYQTTTPLITYGTQKAVYEFYSTAASDYYYSTSSTPPSGYSLNGISFYVFN